MLPPIRKSPFKQMGGVKASESLAEATIAASSSEGITGQSQLQIPSFRFDTSSLDSYNAVIGGNLVMLFDIGHLDSEACI